jgi:integrase
MGFFEGVLALDHEMKTSQYSSVQRWVKALRRKGSNSTMTAYFKYLAWFTNWSKLTPDEFVKLPVSTIVEKVQGFCDEYNDRDRKSSASNAMKAMRSFLKSNGFKVQELELEDSYNAMKRPEYVPTKEEVYRMAQVIGLKWRAVILCLFQSGLRNGAIRALTYGMLRDQIESDATPISVHVTGEFRKIVPDACKEGVNYWTFFGPEACEALRQYVNWRRDRDGVLSDNDVLFPSDSKTFSKEKRVITPMTQTQLTRIVKNSAKKAGLKEWKSVRAHSLRKTFRSVLDMGYIDGGQMAEDDKEYLMGHRLPGAKEPYHNANVNVLNERYIRLRWRLEGAITNAAKIESIKAFARTLGINDMELKIAKLRESKASVSEEEAIGQIMRGELGLDKMELKASKSRDSIDDPKLIVNEADLERYLNDGWDIQTVLPSGKILIKK